MEDFSHADRYLRAKKRVEDIRGFYGNLITYLIVISFLIWLNWLTTSFPWALFPAIGWGFGLLMHGLKVFGYDLVLGRGWEDRKIREYMSREEF